MAPVAVAPYLQAYGFAAVDPKTWRVSPGSSSSSTAPAPVVELQVEGHQEVEGHTLYSLTCALVDGSVNTNWNAQRRLQQLREDLHDVVKVELGDSYSQHFASTPFAHKGGLIGTTARLRSWLCTLATCINKGRIPPSVVALVLSFLDAPEWKLDAVPVQSFQKGLLTPTTQCSSQDNLSQKPKNENAGLDDIELSLTFDLDDLVLGDDLLSLPRVGDINAPVRHATSPSLEGPQAFFVQIAKRDGEDDKLGCDVVSLRYRNLGALRVEDMDERPGLIGEWNTRNPSMQVRPGHYVVEVNGESRDTDRMYDLLTEERVLELRIQRRWP